MNGKGRGRLCSRGTVLHWASSDLLYSSKQRHSLRLRILCSLALCAFLEAS